MSQHLSPHWRYAAENAVAALERDIREFNFATAANGGDCGGVRPQRYIEIIDGFLSEDLTVIRDTDRRNLEVLRKLLVHHIVAAFDVGWYTAIEVKVDIDRLTTPIVTLELHAMARERSPFSGMKREWFVEGFCQSWTNPTGG